MPGGEGVVEVQDGEDEADELSEGHHQGDGQRSALCGQDKDATDAHVPGNRVKVCNKTERAVSKPKLK